jgi:hypothetical protein
VKGREGMNKGIEKKEKELQERLVSLFKIHKQDSEGLIEDIKDYETLLQQELGNASSVQEIIHYTTKMNAAVALRQRHQSVVDLYGTLIEAAAGATGD